MFHDATSSSSEEAAPFNAIKAAAEAKRTIGLADIKDPVYQAITAELNNPVPREPPPPPNRKSRYIGALVEKAVQRKEDNERLSEKRLVARQRQEDALFEGKDRFVTSAYKKKLELDRQKNEIEKLRERKEEERRSKGITGFYGNLFNGGNVAMGGKKEVVRSGEKDTEVRDGNENLSVVKEISRDGKGAKIGGKVMKKRRRSRFGDVKTDAPNAGSEAPPEDKTEAKKEATKETKKETKKVKEPRKRGLRRNDEKSIEEYRRRYFERRAKRFAKQANG